MKSIFMLLSVIGTISVALFIPKIKLDLRRLTATVTIPIRENRTSVVDKSFSNLGTDQVVKVGSEESSVHLKLTQQYDCSQSSRNTTSNNSNVSILEFIDKSNESVLLACIGNNRTRLEIFGYHLFDRNISEDKNVLIRERSIELSDQRTSDSLLSLWKSEKLLAMSKDPLDALKSQSVDPYKKFKDTMLSHAIRMKIMKEESNILEDMVKFLDSQQARFDNRPWRELNFHPHLSRNQTLNNLRAISTWFRSKFPYYYGACQTCGSSDLTEFVGYVYPSPQERSSRAGRTELYRCNCNSCRSTFRFPRFNFIRKVLETRRGRCGEYSIVMLLILRAMGYTVRWVVDWADHCFDEVYVLDDIATPAIPPVLLNTPKNSSVEVSLEDAKDTFKDRGGQWIHLDPCEAAVDEPLIYEGWGKNATYLIAFTDDGAEDVTGKYTSNFDAVKARREVTSEQLEESLEAARKELQSSKKTSISK